MKHRILIAALLLVTFSVLAYAHGGMIHVMGTATALTEKSITVKTTDQKIVQIALTESTTYQSESQPSTRRDLQVGDRVVIHAVKTDDSLQAHEVRFTHGTPVSPH
jgi:hypothetical protein